MPEFAVDPGLILFLFNAAAVWPLMRIFRRAGFSPWWALVIFVPVIGLVGVLGLLTVRRWPARVLVDGPARTRKARRAA
ncbi:hypothetical protein D9623_00855 [Azospirillum brasilense]|uniref:Uncharacterized protein n=2 Tax=Azospirillum TaxID=191 RepID=A0A0P0EVV2_AZOBR|nr:MULTISPECIES: hypothetical protein [Azospirillum]ALJ34173.1 hypothetical protein AMK58_01365 [Azospirillum brasilense]KAA0686688.1 hypothetical protein DS837_09545 [Azospirillum brasilense]MBK3735303.1 hypothetical protein [Azospirillum brasilense]MDW7552845.1 hypothetical protein [Azospirillum brasilense]MDW7591963.1 hypothetical protein [Azospirillum brasilense]